MLRSKISEKDQFIYRLKQSSKLLKFHFAHLFIRCCHTLPGSGHRNFAEFGQSLEFSYWVYREFGSDSVYLPTRFKLWKKMIKALDTDRDTAVFEFGVAYGTATRWWLSNCDSITSWIGFDTFTGLPSPWRHHPAGAFSTKGHPPDVSDSRVRWITGKVEETLGTETLAELIKKSGASSQRIFLFDLDLYGPTKHVLESIMAHLQEGDILYFDEAADFDERRAFLELREMSSFSFKLLGATPMAMAVEIGSR